MNKHTIDLCGLDGGNPLAFLAALGTLRGLGRALPDQDIRMSWKQLAGWRPVIHFLGESSEDDVMDALLDEFKRTRDYSTLEIADNLTIPLSEYREHLKECVEPAHKDHDSEPTAFAAAFGSDAIGDEKGISDTALRTMSGAGHQHFLETMRNLLAEVTREHLSRTLFNDWSYQDSLKKLSLRFDPFDDKQYALQWMNPSNSKTRYSGNMLGANALAVLGIPLLPTAPVGTRLETTGFSGHRRNEVFWTWPIWEKALTLDVVQSVLALSELQRTDEAGRGPDRTKLSSMGIAEVYRSQRVNVGKFRNFTSARPV